MAYSICLDVNSREMGATMKKALLCAFQPILHPRKHEYETSVLLSLGLAQNQAASNIAYKISLVRLPSMRLIITRLRAQRRL